MSHPVYVFVISILQLWSEGRLMEISTSETLMLNFMIISVYHDLREQEEELEVPEVEEHAENITKNDEIKGDAKRNDTTLIRMNTAAFRAYKCLL